MPNVLTRILGLAPSSCKSAANDVDLQVDIHEWVVQFSTGGLGQLLNLRRRIDHCNPHDQRVPRPLSNWTAAGASAIMGTMITGNDIGL
jgi:hypothetical protein